MKHALQLRQTQRLQLNAQLTQSLRVLQLSRIELDLEIRSALDSNPFLEETGFANASVVDIDPDDLANSTASPGAPSPSPADSSFDAPSAEMIANETRWDEGGYPSYMSTDGEFSQEPDRSVWADPVRILQQRLLAELALQRLSPSEALMANALIGCLDERGYVTASHLEVRAILKDHLCPSDEELDAVLQLIQSVGLPGIGARDLRECLLLQLKRLDPLTPGLADAVVIIDSHMDLLAAHAYPALMEKIGTSKEDLAKAIALIQSLDPKPGEQISPKPTETLVPDVIAKQVEGHWTVRLTRRDSRRIRVNDSYRDYLKTPDADTRKYIKDHLRDAQGFVKSLEQREQTVLRVAEAILAIQQNFMHSGDHGLKPLTLHNLADTLDIHESTVSRAINQKYLLTPLGVYPLKHFFSVGLGGDTEDRVSARAAKAMIRKVIECEPAEQPISDGALAKLLGAEGIPIARRTVAKYRDQMNIPPATQRRGIRSL